MRRTLIPMLLVLGLWPRIAVAQSGQASADASRQANLNAYVELLRTDIRSQKVALMTSVMNFTEAEDAKFWPVYREYELELAKINDDRVAMIKEYGNKYSTLTDADADRLARTALELESRRNALLGRYYDRIKSQLSSKAAVRFLQVEHQILLLLDLQIAAALPVVQ